MHLYTLAEWLLQISSVHPCEMELGLDRVKLVAERLDLIAPPCATLIIGGTNGKGSTVAALEAIYGAAGYRTGVFSTPTLFKHNEQVRINGEMVNDEAFCTAFSQIESARGEVSLTPFEFHTLAAMLIMKSHPLDVWILEVGLGGRLDAVNIIDADVSVVTSIGIDHTEWLGDTREKIGFEKAGIFRAGRKAVCGDPNPPISLMKYAEQIGAELYCQSSLRGTECRSNPEDASGLLRRFASRNDGGSGWDWYYADVALLDLPKPVLHLQNMSTALMAIHLLLTRLPVERTAIDKGLATVNLPGRIQIIPGAITHIYDVAHNPDAVSLLAQQLQALPCAGKTYAVFSMLGDKDILTSVRNIQSYIDAWFVAPLATKRAATEVQLRAAFQQAAITAVEFLPTIEKAYQAALQQAQAGDRIIIFGSFHTVASIADPNSECGRGKG